MTLAPQAPPGPEPRPLQTRARELGRSLERFRERPWGRRIALAGRVGGFLLSVGLVAWVTSDAIEGAHLDEDDMVLVAASVLPALISWLALGRAWAALTGADGALGAIGTWSRTQALRYLPGAFWGSAARAASVEGAPTTKASTVIVEAALTVGVGAAIGGVGLATGGSWAWSLLVLVGAVTPLALHLAGRRSPLPLSRVLRASGWYAVSWLAFAGSVALSQAAVGPLHSTLAIMGAGSLARVAGMVAFFAPGGVGVREVAYVALVGTMLPTDQAAAGALLSRLVLVVVELAVLLAIGMRWSDRSASSAKGSAIAAERPAQAAPSYTGEDGEPDTRDASRRAGHEDDRVGISSVGGR